MFGCLVNSRLMRPLRDSVKHVRLLETNEENTMTMPIAILVACIGTVAVLHLADDRPGHEEGEGVGVQLMTRLRL
jgi:hypothetical protein